MSQKPREERRKVEFKPKAPTLKEAVTDLIALFDNQFDSPKFASGLVRSFQKVGMTPLDNGEWAQYERYHTAGTMKFAPAGAFDAQLFDRSEDPDVQHAIIENIADNILDREHIGSKNRDYIGS